MPLVLSNDEIHLWFATTDSPFSSHQEAYLLGLLASEDERNRYYRLRSVQGRRSYVAAHALLRLVLSCYLHRPARSWEFVADRYGKPHLADGGPSFNLSHTEGWVVCALAEGVALGVDVERRDRHGDWVALAQRWLAIEEQDWLMQHPPEERSDAFLRLWTLKESYVKALGLGLALPFREFAVCVLPDRSPTLLRQPLTLLHENWQLANWSSDTHWLALAALLAPGEAARKIVFYEGTPLLKPDTPEAVTTGEAFLEMTVPLTTRVLRAT